MIIVDVSLFIIFVGASSAAMAMLWRKLPLLVQVPARLIEESFATRPSRIARHLIPLVAFFRAGRAMELYYAGLIWLLHHLRLRLLRMERFVFRLLEGLRQRNPRFPKAEERYWGELKQWKTNGRENGNHLPEAVLNPDPPPEVEAKEFPKNGKNTPG